MNEHAVDDLIDRIHDMANALGWSFRIDGASNSTISVYVDLWRDCRGESDTDESIEDYGYTGQESVRVRISDHGNAHYYDGEQMHIRMDCDPEADLELLRARLSRPAMV